MTSACLYRSRVCSIVCLAVLGSTVLSARGANTKIRSLKVYPADALLTTSRDSQSFIVQVVQDDGITRDVTDQAKFTVSNAKIVRVNKNVLLPSADGNSTLTVAYGGLQVTVPVTVQQAKTDRRVSFQLDVMPVFLKAGCNAGSCHGAALGKDGFRLSLFGFDPAGDYYRLTREISGRRLNLALPEESLLIEKVLGRVPHTGGRRFGTDSVLYEALMRWVRAGAPSDVAQIPKVVSVELYPPGGVLDGRRAEQKLTVRAQYSDGTSRDVTKMAYFSSSNDNSAVVSQQGIVTAASRGESFITARFEKHTVGTRFIVLPKGLKFQWPNPPEYNYIDTLVYSKLRKLKVSPSRVCTDEEFLRRICLDIMGTLPTIERYGHFTKSSDPHKREHLVKELLGRKEFVDIWTMKWAELLQVRSLAQTHGNKAIRLYYNWLRKRIAHNVPMDKMVQELLSSQGSTFSNPATNYYMNDRDPRNIAENVAQVFMGMRIQCARCHNHPFDRWTMEDYYGFAAFFPQIGRKWASDPRKFIVYNTGAGEVRHPLSNQVVKPKFLGGAVPNLRGEDRRKVMAQWLASPSNPYFAKNLSNIVWAHFLGRGIVNEVDDVRISNPPVNAELLDELGRRFTGYKYNFKKLVRDICTSRTYQLSTATNSTNRKDLTNFSHAAPRRIRSEILLDVITQVTNTKNKFYALPPGTRAIQIADGNTSTYFLTSFGRTNRASVCSCEVRMEPNLSQVLHLINGNTVNQKIKEGRRVPTLLADGRSPDDITTELYIRCLSRKPTPEEHAALHAMLATEKDRKIALEDIFWALLNSREFLFNH